MTQAERLNLMEDYVNEHGFCSVQELTKMFGISRATANRDIRQLCLENRMIQTRGGVMSHAKGTKFEFPPLVKMKLHVEEKVRIAHKACSLIKNDQIILLDSTSVSAFMLSGIAKISGLSVVTNDLMAAYNLAAYPNINLVMVGGAVRKGYYSLSGMFALQTLEQIRADIAFIGVDAVSVDDGYMITNAEEIEVKRLMLQAAKQSVILCDHSKFDNVAFLRLCAIENADTIITGKELRPEIKQQLEQKQVELILA